MKVIIHAIDMEDENSSCRLIVKSVKLKRLPSGWTKSKYLYFVSSKEFDIKKVRLLDYQIEQLYEATHDIPNCEDCELVEAPINYRQMEMEDRD